MPLNTPPNRWLLPAEPPTGHERLSRELGLPPILARLLCRRGLADPEQAAAFLRTELAGLPPFHGLRGLTAAVALLADALEQKRTIGVAGDYDADGVCATALLVEFLETCGGRVVWDLPHRLQDGYGFTPGRADRLAQAGVNLVVTVDCGISDHPGVTRATELGMEVIVTDHHQVPPGPMVPAAAVVNPQRSDCGFCPHLAGVGVAFYLVAGLRAHLRQRDWFRLRPEPNLRHCLDLVAVGTLADVVPLKDHNRILVAQGLKVLAEGHRPGLAAMLDALGGLGGNPSRTVAFFLAPRLNAAGRLSHPGTALELLLAPDLQRAKAPLAQLEEYNSRRKQVETNILDQALAELDQDPELENRRFLTLWGPGWHLGVLGLVASRLVEQSNRPALVLAVNNGSATGSGRSLPGFHLQKALAAQAELLTRYGGHAMAAGLTLPTSHLPALAQRLDEAAHQALPAWEDGRAMLLDDQVELGELTPPLIESLDRLGPFGQDNPDPLWLCAGLTVRGAREVGRGHLKMELTANGQRAQAIWFGQAQRLAQLPAQVDVAFHPQVSSYGGVHLELLVKDLRPAQ